MSAILCTRLPDNIVLIYKEKTDETRRHEQAGDLNVISPQKMSLIGAGTRHEARR